MPVYKYEAITNDGVNVSAKIDASSKNELIEKLRKQKLYPISVEEININKKRGISFQSKVKTVELTIFLRQLSTLIGTGVPIVESLDIIRNQLKEGKFKKVMGEVYESIHKGSTFSESLKLHPDVFSEIMINMIESGEVSGSLELVVERLALNFEKDEKIRKKIKGAMIYPIVLSGVAVIVVFFLLMFVMPTFIGMFESSGVELALPTRILIAMGNFLRDRWYIFFGVIGAIIFALKRYLSLPEGRMRFDHMKMKIPYLKTVTINLMTSRFSRTLSTLLYSGVPLLDALENTAKVIGNVVMEKDIMNSREEVRMGHELAIPISNIPYLPSMLSSMIKIGEESGSLDTILDKTAEYYENEVESSIQQMTAMFEPLLIVVMGVVIGYIIIAMALPMFDMANTVQ